MVLYHVNDEDFRGNGVILGLLQVFIGTSKPNKTQSKDCQCHKNPAGGCPQSHSFEDCKSTVGAAEQLEQSQQWESEEEQGGVRAC